MAAEKEEIMAGIKNAKEMIGRKEYDQALDLLSSLHSTISEIPADKREEYRQHYAEFFKLLAEAKWHSGKDFDSNEIIRDLDKSLSWTSSSGTLQLKADIIYSSRESEYKRLYQQATDLDDSVENRLKFIIALEKSGQHRNALRNFHELLRKHITPEDLREIRKFLKDTGRSTDFRESGRYSDYRNAFHSRYPRRKKRSGLKNKNSISGSTGGLKKEFFWPLASSFAAGLYISVFHITNNLTMLPVPSIIALFFILTLPALILTTLAYLSLKIIRKGHLTPVVSIALSTVYLLLILKSSLTGFDYVNAGLNVLGGTDSLSANLIYFLVPVSLTTFIFRDNSKKFSLVLSAMIIAIFIMPLNKDVSSHDLKAAKDWGNWQQYRDVSLVKKPNIFVIIPDSYGSISFMKDVGIDISDFQEFLTRQKFQVYNDTFSNYQPTTASLPAFLNMEHHYYTIVARNFTEVEKPGRLIIGGHNNFFRILKNNGYEVHNIHQGTSLLLQGHNADYSYPRISDYAGAKIVLGRLLKNDLLTEEEKDWKKFSSEEVHEEVISHIPGKDRGPVAQYIHLFTPGHSNYQNQGKCKEQEEIKRYSRRLRKANTALEKLITDIISQDPGAVILVAGDHGPYVLNKCAWEGILKTDAQLRDRAGILTAVRWPDSYNGQFDRKIKTSVNFLRYLLASLAGEKTELLESAVAEDVYVKMKNFRENNAFFKAVEDGRILNSPENLIIPEKLRLNFQNDK